MNFSSSGTCPIRSAQRLHQCSIRLTLAVLLILTLFGGTTACSVISHREVLYARATRQKAETQGYMHLAQPQVKVFVQGDATIRDFKVEQVVGAAGYAILLDEDLAKLVENTQVLSELSKDPSLLAAIRAAQTKIQAQNAATPTP